MNITLSWRRLLNWWRHGVWTPCRHTYYWHRYPSTGFRETTYACYDCGARTFVRNGRVTTTKHGTLPPGSMR